MPPTRWPFLAVLAIFLVLALKNADANHHNSHLSPLTSNGWRPILGERYEKRGQIIPESSNIVPQVVENIHSQNIRPNNGQNLPKINNQHRIPENQSHNSKKNQPNQQFSQPDGLKPPNNQNVAEKDQNIRNKNQVKSQGSHGNFIKNNNSGKIRVNHHGSTGHHSKHTMLPSKPVQVQKPLHKPVSQMHMSKGPVRHQSNLGNKAPHQGPNGKRPNKSKQPYRTQATAHSQKEEIIAPAPSSGIGSYTYFNQGPFNIRDTQLGDRTKGSFHHPEAFRNHYPNIQSSNSDLIQQIHHGFGKHPSQNELHNSNFNQFYNQNDEYTRNLVPPPPLKPTDIQKDSVENQKVAPQNSKQFLLKGAEDFGSLGFPPKFNYEVRPHNLEITRENIREYHTTLAPPIFSKGTTEGYSTIKFTNKPLSFNNHGYEVTEDKRWQESSPFYQPFSRPTTPVRLQTYPTILPSYQETTQFLPTPFIESFPTINPQEASTVYSEVSKYNRQNYQPNHYNIKEVATHFPIFEIKSPMLQNINHVQNSPAHVEEAPKKVVQEQQVTEEYMPPTQEPTRAPKPTRTRQNVRRRRPTRPTTTEASEISTEAPEVTSERPRRRRPMKPKPTESKEDNRGFKRRPKPPVVEEEPENYPANFPIRQPEEVTENYPQIKPQETRKFEESIHNYRVEVEPTTTEYPKPTALQYSDEPEDVETTTMAKRKRIKTTTEGYTQQTSFSFPENELDFTTTPYYSQEIVTEEPRTPETTTMLTTSTSTEGTTKTHRIRRPPKYNLRPRFSVKDYKEKLNQLSSTTEISKITTSSTVGRIKYPSRFTKEPNSKEDDTEMLRFRFKPKDPRHRASTEPISSTESTTEKYKPNRIRPFGRIRTTESTTTSAPKVSIKPNIFSNLKRPQTPGLRTRIFNKNKTLTTTEAPVTTEEPISDEESAEIVEVTLPPADNHMEITTESFRRILDNTSPDYEDENVGEKSADEADAFLHLQRITELTSQAKNNHFKTMSTASRRVPSYFTISTDDPILPIEAFFSKINQDQEQ